MKISFIIPCYNAAPYVRKCVESIIAMNQSDIEIIAINDGSTDNTLEVLNRLCLEYPIQLINFETASGYAGRPRNAGIDAASGEYLAFIDPDDYYIGSNIVSSYEQYRGYDVIVNSFHICNPEGKVTDKVILKNSDVDRTKFLWRQVVNVCNQRSLFKRDFILKNNIRYFEDCRSQDLLFLYGCYVVGSKIRTTNLVTTMYLDERADSVSNNISPRYIESSIIAYERFFHLINDSLCCKEVDSAIGEHFLGYYLKVRSRLSSKQKELIMSTDFYNHIKHQVVKVKNK
ncbi:glycosyltransferase family 2 protein [Mollicutes bacterium LVI A0039]|nr:glycosyltransferase family 2 protein [Mollicutes bacterium LVI A0039]